MARGLPCERFTAVLANRPSCITRGRGGWLDLPRGGLAPPILCQLSWRTPEWVKTSRRVHGRRRQVHPRNRPRRPAVVASGSGQNSTPVLEKIGNALKVAASRLLSSERALPRSAIGGSVATLVNQRFALRFRCEQRRSAGGILLATGWEARHLGTLGCCWRNRAGRLRTPLVRAYARHDLHLELVE